MKRLLLLLIFFACASNANAQWLDTLRNDFKGGAWPTASFDSRNSFISDRRAHIWGIKFGVEFNSRLQFGLGYNFHDQRLTKDIQYINDLGHITTTKAELHLSYVCMYARYVYYDSEKWTFSIMPIQLGFGGSSYQYLSEHGTVKTDKSGIVTYEPGISVSYSIFWWLGVGGDFGYRYMIKKNPDIPENFNSPIYTFYLIFNWGEMYKRAFPNTKLAKML